MSWFSNFLTSSIGKKLVMSLTGLFLIVFLLVHLTGNLQLLINDGGRQFNLYAKFMTTNPLIKATSIGLYAFILLHALQGILLWLKNRSAKGGGYAVSNTKATNTVAGFAKNMGWLGIIILVFLVIHMYQFWFQMHWGDVVMVDYDGTQVKNLYAPVAAAFSNVGFVVFYTLSMIVIAFHLWHGFQSSFQTLGLNHKKYTPFIQFLGKVYSVAVPLGFASIPIIFFFIKNN